MEMVALAEVGMRRASGGIEVVAEEPLWREGVGLLVPGRIPVEVGQVGKDDGSLRDALTVVGVVAGGGVRHAEAADGGPAMDFFDEGAEVGEVGLVGKAWQTRRSDDAVEFCRG